MELPGWFDRAFTLSLTLPYWQQLGLAFLLGSFAVATWSDLKRLSAQREFLEIWLGFLACVLVLDVYAARAADTPWQIPAVKWGLIVLLSLLSLQSVPLPFRLFRLAAGDVAALAAAASLLTPVLILALYLAAKLLSLVLRPVLARGRAFYPFMPVVTLATLAVLALGLFRGAGLPAGDVGQNPYAERGRVGLAANRVAATEEASTTTRR